MAVVNIHNLPIELHCMLLSRVGDPRLARVCKAWRDIIDKQTKNELKLIGNPVFEKIRYKKYINYMVKNDPQFLKNLFTNYPRISNETFHILNSKHLSHSGEGQRIPRFNSLTFFIKP